LCWFHLNEQRENVKDVQQFGRVPSNPVVGLDFSKLGRRSSVADDRPLTFFYGG
jgi:hypothetical protein